MSQTVNIRPGVSVLSVLRHLNYKPWFALAEFVDNSLQSFAEYAEELREADGSLYVLRVSINLQSDNGGRITIRDNAAGIHVKDYSRAFRAAEIPPDRSGLSEFGMGMKSAACWFASRWSVRTSALGETVEKQLTFDINSIVRDSIEELDVISSSINPAAHFTEIVLEHLHKAPQGTTIRKIKDHLASIYRTQIRDGVLILKFNGDVLSYEDPKILVAPYYRDESGARLTWRKPIDFDFGFGMRVTGFAAIRETASTSQAGFALFRRGRLIQGGVDEGYRPEVIFGKSNSFVYQRLFGELHLEGFEVSHTKDGFRWDENEEVFLELLKEQLDAQPFPLIQQAREYRVKFSRDALEIGATTATNRVAETIRREIPPVLSALDGRLEEGQPPEVPAPSLPLARRTIEVQFHDQRWYIIVEMTNDPAEGEWLELWDSPPPLGAERWAETRTVGARLSLAHPFMQRFGGADPTQLEPLLRVAVALALAETIARDSGMARALTIRRNVNELLKTALSKA